MEEKPKSKGYVLRKLFFACLYLSTFTFGGGYVIVTLLKEKFVDHYHWIEEDEMLDLVAIAQSSPGAIAVNGAIIVGYKLAGIPGMLVSVIGAIIPPMVILSVISVFYDAFCSNYYIAALLKGMTAGVGAVIMSVVYDMGKNDLYSALFKFPSGRGIEFWRRICRNAADTGTGGESAQLAFHE